MNLNLLEDLRSEGLWLRRINIRQVEGQGFQKISENDFKNFKEKVRHEIDKPLLEEIFPVGSKLSRVWWESQGDRIRVPEQVEKSYFLLTFNLWEIRYYFWKTDRCLSYISWLPILYLRN